MFKTNPLRFALYSALALALSAFAFGFMVSSASSVDDDVINSLGQVDSVRFVSFPTNDIVFNPSDNKLYTSVPSTAGSIGNSITPVDPYTGAIGSSVYIGSDPAKLAIANDGQTLYAYLSGAFSVGRYNIATQSPIGRFLVTADSFYGLLVATDIAVSPDDPNVIAIARNAQGVSPPQQGVAIYNNGARLSQVGPGHSEGSNYLAFAETGTTLYGTGQYSGVKRYSVSGGGATVAQSTSLAAGSPIKYAGGTIFSASGQVINAASMTLLGTFPGVTSANGVFVPEVAVGRVFFLVPGSPGAYSLKAFDVNTFTEVGSLPISNVIGTPTSLVRWGTNGLAFRTSGGQIVLIQTSLIPTPNPIPSPSATPVVTPSPTPTPFSVAVRQVGLTANDVMYNSSQQKLYATVPSSVGAPRGNTLTEIDPVTAEIGPSTPVGSEPGRIGVTEDESALYIGINGSAAVRRFDFAGSTLGPLIGLGLDFNGPTRAFDIEVMPGSNNTVAVARNNGQISIYDSGVRRTTDGSGGVFIDFASPDVLFSSGNLNNVTKHGVGPGGLSQVASLNAGIVGDIEVKNNKIYSANGRVVDANLTSVDGTYFGLGSENAVVVDEANNRAIFVTNNSGTYSIRAYELGTFRLIGSVPLPSLGLVPSKVVRWGTNGLAFRTEFNRIFIVQTNLIDGGAPVPTPSPTPPITPTPTPTPATTFVRRLNIPANDLIVNSSNTVIASVAGIAGAPLGNTMTHINPANGQVLSSAFIGSEPNRIAASDDGQTLWTTLTGANAIRNYNYQTQTAGLQFVPPANFQQIQDMAVMPGTPSALAIAARQSGVAIFDNGVQRPSAGTGGAYAINSIEFSDSPGLLYGYENESSGFGLMKFTVTASGVTGVQLASNLISGFGTHIKYHNGLLYTTNGRVVDPVSLSLVGTFQGGGSAMAIDAATNRIFFISDNTISAFDMQTYVKIGSFTIPGFSGTPTSLARWGTNGLVFRAPLSFGSPDTNIYLVQTALVSTAEPIPTGLALNSATPSGSEGSSNITITVTRTGETSTTASVDYATADGTAVAGVDYQARSGNLIFAPGEVSKTVLIPMINDTIYEGAENFTFNLSNAAGPNVFLVSPTSATVSIIDNDQRPTVSNAGTTILEPNLGRNAIANVLVQLTNPSFETVSVNFATSAATATAGADYVSTNGTVTFAPFETAKMISVQILPDLVSEPNETLTVNLSGATNTTIISGAATVTIVNLNHAAHMFDFDGDAKTDIGIFRPPVGEWWIYRSATQSAFAAQFGASTDKIVPTDFTGDGKTDVAVWRPVTGEWIVLRSENNTYYSAPFGAATDIPAPADYDADGKADLAVYRPSTGYWFINRSGDGGLTSTPFGGNAGDIPIPADYDGDGKADLGIYYVAGGEWWLSRSTAGLIVYQFGNSSDKIAPGDYTGDGKTDVAFWRPVTGEWFVLRSEDGSYFSAPFGASDDIPAAGDYDGDGKFDFTVFRPSTGYWFVNRTSGGTSAQLWGVGGDKPIPSAFLP